MVGSPPPAPSRASLRNIIETTARPALLSLSFGEQNPTQYQCAAGECIERGMLANARENRREERRADGLAQAMNNTAETRTARASALRAGVRSSISRAP